jgi:hypothetical protein
VVKRLTELRRLAAPVDGSSPPVRKNEEGVWWVLTTGTGGRRSGGVGRTMRTNSGSGMITMR